MVVHVASLTILAIFIILLSVYITHGFLSGHMGPTKRYKTIPKLTRNLPRKGAVLMKKTPQSGDYKPLRPSLSTEGRANQLVSLAYDLAERQLREGTASSQVITEFLKLGSTKASLELEKLKRENELLTAKADKIKSEQRSEEMFAEAIRAMQRYNGERIDEEVDEFDY